MLDVRRLRVLQRFAVLGSINATAEDLGYSASAISQQLSTLEREAGVPLLERTARSARLTDAGRELAGYAVDILDRLEDAQSRMRARAGVVAGDITVISVPSLAARLAAELAVAQSQYAELTVVAREADASGAAEAVVDGRADLAVIDGWYGDLFGEDSGLTVEELAREPVLLALPADHPRAARSAPVTAAELRELLHADETWLCTPAGQPSRIAGDDRLAADGVVPARRWEFQGLHVLATLVAAHAGLALLPAPIAAEVDGVVGLELRPRMRRRIAALFRATRQRDPALATCLAAARRAMADKPAPAALSARPKRRARPPRTVDGGGR